MLSKKQPLSLEVDCVVPFGLTSAPATFQRLMEQVMRGLHWKTLLLYLDAVIVVSPTFESQLDRLAVVFERLGAANLKLKPSKCELFQERVKYCTWDMLLVLRE